MKGSKIVGIFFGVLAGFLLLWGGVWGILRIFVGSRDLKQQKGVNQATRALGEYIKLQQSSRSPSLSSHHSFSFEAPEPPGLTWPPRQAQRYPSLLDEPDAPLMSVHKVDLP